MIYDSSASARPYQCFKIGTVHRGFPGILFSYASLTVVTRFVMVFLVSNQRIFSPADKCELPPSEYLRHNLRKGVGVNVFDREKHNIFKTVDCFKPLGGVSFCIHVIYQDNIKDQTEKSLLLAGALHDPKPSNQSSDQHVDQKYLQTIETDTLKKLDGKHIVRVEIDDTLTFCSFLKGGCGEVVPKWIRQKWPTAKIYQFVHNDDTINLSDSRWSSKQHVYDVTDVVLDNSEIKNHDEWGWSENGSSSVNVNTPPIPKRSMVRFRCTQKDCDGSICVILIPKLKATWIADQQDAGRLVLSAISVLMGMVVSKDAFLCPKGGKTKKHDINVYKYTDVTKNYIDETKKIMRIVEEEVSELEINKLGTVTAVRVIDTF